MNTPTPTVTYAVEYFHEGKMLATSEFSTEPAAMRSIAGRWCDAARLFKMERIGDYGPVPASTATLYA